MKKSFTIWLRGAGAALVLGSVALFTPGCAVHEHGYAEAGPYYEYDYYPESDVYFYPAGSVYHWYDGGHWLSGQRLPPRYTLNHEHREHLRFKTRHPWTEHKREHWEHH